MGDVSGRAASIALAFSPARGDSTTVRTLATGSLTTVLVQLTRTNGLPALDTAFAFPSGADSIVLGLRVRLAPNAPASGEAMTLRVALVDVGGIDICTGGPEVVVAAPAWNAAPVPVPLSCVEFPVPIDSLLPIDSLFPPIDSMPVVPVVSQLSFGTVVPTVLAGVPLASEIAVTALDAAGAPVPTFTQPVTVSAVGPAGAVLGGTRTVTAAGGIARFTDLVLTTAGSYHLSAASDGFTAASNTFDILPADPRRLAGIGGAGQSGLVGALLDSAVAVVVTDAFGNGVPGVEVAWQLLTGLGQLLNPVTTTDRDGIARNQWTLGLLPGAQSITAAVPGLAGSPVTFTAQALLPASTARDLP